MAETTVDEPMPASTLVGGPGQPLSAAQYEAGLEMLAQAFRLVQLVPIEPLREHLSKAETLGPILDPTAYMRGGRERLQDQRDVIEAAAAVWKAVDRVRARMEQRAGKVAS